MKTVFTSSEVFFVEALRGGLYGGSARDGAADLRHSLLASFLPSIGPLSARFRTRCRLSSPAFKSEEAASHSNAALRLQA